MKKNRFLAGIMVAALAFVSCENGGAEDADLEQNPTGMVNSVSLEASVEGVESTLDEYAFYGGNYLNFGGISSRGFHDRAGFFSNCAELMAETVDETTTITITFPEDCEDRRGNLVSGTITIVYSQTDANKSRSATFTDFSVNGYLVNGTRTYSYSAANANGNPEIAGTVDLSIETEEGTIAKSGSRLIEITAGGDTDTYTDDEKTITGSRVFTDAEGNRFSVEITEPLVKPAGCHYIATGIKQYTENDAIAVLDYGDGNCDSVAELTAADGTITEIELRRGRRGFYR